MNNIRERRAFDHVCTLIDTDGTIRHNVEVTLVATVEWKMDKNEIENFRILKLKMGDRTLRASAKFESEVCRLLVKPEENK